MFTGISILRLAMTPKHSHLFFSCSFSRSSWAFISQSFGWPLTLPTNLWSLSDIILLGHLFKSDKETLWLNFILSILWSLWLEMNSHIFSSSLYFLLYLLLLGVTMSYIFFNDQHHEYVKEMFKYVWKLLKLFTFISLMACFFDVGENLSTYITWEM